MFRAALKRALTFRTFILCFCCPLIGCGSVGVKCIYFGLRNKFRFHYAVFMHPTTAVKTFEIFKVLRKISISVSAYSNMVLFGSCFLLSAQADTADVEERDSAVLKARLSPSPLRSNLVHRGKIENTNIYIFVILFAVCLFFSVYSICFDQTFCPCTISPVLKTTYATQARLLSP